MAGLRGQPDGPCLGVAPRRPSPALAAVRQRLPNGIALGRFPGLQCPPTARRVRAQPRLPGLAAARAPVRRGLGRSCPHRRGHEHRAHRRPGDLGPPPVEGVDRRHPGCAGDRGVGDLARRVLLVAVGRVRERSRLCDRRGARARPRPGYAPKRRGAPSPVLRAVGPELALARAPQSRGVTVGDGAPRPERGSVHLRWSGRPLGSARQRSSPVGALGPTRHLLV